MKKTSNGYYFIKFIHDSQIFNQIESIKKCKDVIFDENYPVKTKITGIVYNISQS